VEILSKWIIDPLILMVGLLFMPTRWNGILILVSLKSKPLPLQHISNQMKFNLFQPTLKILMKFRL